MSDPVALRRTLEADLENMPKLGPAQELVECVTVPGRDRAFRMRFKLTDRRGHILSYAATCPRCRDSKIKVETTMHQGKTLWPPVNGFPQLCEACEDEPVPLIKRDDVWDAAIEQQREQLKQQRRASQ